MFDATHTSLPVITMSADGVSVASAHDNAGVRMPPPLIYIGLLVLGFIIQFFWPLRIAVQPYATVTRVGGLVLIVTGVLSFGSAIGLFRSVGTSLIPVKPTTALTFAGPYRFTRNPMYLGMLLISGGIALMTNALWPLLMLPLMVIVVTRTVIRREERYLTAKFGESYTAYKLRVRRWI